MKNLQIRILIVSLIMLCFNIGFSQNVTYTYDDAGNRLTRALLVIQKITSATNNIESVEKSVNCISGNKSITIDNVVVKVSPNPNGGRFDVTIDKPKQQTKVGIYLHSLNGTLVYEENKANTTNTINITNRENGTYILTVTVNGSKETWKVIKQ